MITERSASVYPIMIYTLNRAQSMYMYAIVTTWKVTS